MSRIKSLGKLTVRHQMSDFPGLHSHDRDHESLVGCTVEQYKQKMGICVIKL